MPRLFSARLVNGWTNRVLITAIIRTSNQLERILARGSADMKAVLAQAMQAADDYVISLDYLDNKGVLSRRIVSPIRFLAGNRVLALCLCREEPRQFYLDRCFNVRLCRASDFVMPVPMFVVDTVPMAAAV